MVITDKIGMICDACGGRCPAGTDNYDDVMHLEGCKHRARLDVWINHPKLQAASHDGMLCVMHSRNIMDMTKAPFARSCPAHSSLFSALPYELHDEDSSIRCTHREECYNKYYEEFEEEVLVMLDEWETIKTVSAVDNFLSE